MGLRFGEYCLITKETQEKIAVLLRTVESGCRLTEKMGNGDFGFMLLVVLLRRTGGKNFEELHEDGEYNTFDDFVQSWKENYPLEEILVRDNDFPYIRIILLFVSIALWLSILHLKRRTHGLNGIALILFPFLSNIWIRLFPGLKMEHIMMVGELSSVSLP